MNAPRPTPGRRDEKPAPARAPSTDGSGSSRRERWRPSNLASRGAETRENRARANGSSKLEPPVDPRSWTGALILMVAAGAVLWAVQIVNAVDHYDLDRYGLRPRTLRGLEGVLTQPFLHESYAHLASNTLPFVLIGWVVLMGSVRVWAIVTATVVLLGGLLTWVVGPGDTVIVGASGLVFGWLGYLLARAYFSRSIKWIIVAVVVLVFFGTLLISLFPYFDSNVSWQSHICGFAAGVAIAWVLHPRGRQLRQFRRSAVS